MYGEKAHGRKECAVERTLDVLSNRWTSLIVRELLRGTQRFNQLKQRLPGISPKTLTERLKALEEQGIVVRTLYAQVPPKVEYHLSPKGQDLADIFAAMGRWGERWT